MGGFRKNKYQMDQLLLLVSVISPLPSPSIDKSKITVVVVVVNVNPVNLVLETKCTRQQLLCSSNMIWDKTAFVVQLLMIKLTLTDSLTLTPLVYLNFLDLFTHL
jgi:hypothetical protein